MPDDFCIEHGYEHMKSQFGNPIPYCEACERKRTMRVTKQFDREKGLPFWYLEFDGEKYGPFSTREEAYAWDDREVPTGEVVDPKLVAR